MTDEAPRGKRRYKLRKLRLSEVSLVDRGAGAGTEISVFKRRTDPEPPAPPTPPPSTDAEDDPRWRLNAEQREIMEALRKTTDAIEARFPGLHDPVPPSGPLPPLVPREDLERLDSHALHLLNKAALNLRKTIADVEISRRKAAARREAEAAFAPSPSKVVELLKAETAKAEALAAKVERVAEQAEVDAVLKAQRARDERVRRAEYKRGGMTWAQMRQARGEEK